MKHLHSRVKKFLSYKKAARITGAVIVLALVFSFIHISQSIKPHYVEVGFSSLSPSGTTGGSIIPASCSSGVFDSGDAVACNPSNACGSNPGTIVDCAGDCSVGPPSCTPPTVTVSPPIVLIGSTVTVNWFCPAPSTSSTNSWAPGTAGVSGTRTFTINQTTTYSVQCSSGASNSAIATVINPTISLTATPSRVNSGQTSLLKWNASSVTSCQIRGPGINPPAVSADGSGNVGTPASQIQTTTAPITAQSTYTVTCQTSAGPKSATVNVSLIPVIIEI